MQEKIKGYIDHIIFRNEDNGYTVFVLIQGKEELTCVGTFQSISPGELIEASGKYIQHHTYGDQFQIDAYEVKVPEDTQAMERYLGSGAIKGIGPALAARIVKKLRESVRRKLRRLLPRLQKKRI